MRIGYCIPGWPPGSVPNGIASTYGNLGRQLREMGHEVFYVAMHSESPVRDPYVTVLDDSKEHTFIEKLRFKLNFESGLFRATSDRIAAAINAVVRNRAVDIFQMEETHGWARVVIERVPIPIVVRLHGPWFLHGSLSPLEDKKPENRHRISREREGIYAAAGVTAPSKNVMGLSEAFYGPLTCPTDVIPNPLSIKSGSARWRLENCDRNVILFVGRFDLHKGADILLRGFAELARDRPAVRLIFVGPDIGLTLEGNGRISFEEFVRRELPLDVRDRIEYRGQLRHGEIDELRTVAYMNVVCSRYENFPNTVLEAISAGCPLVATDTGGIPEMVVHNRNGLLIPAGDVQELAAAMGKMLDDPQLACALGNQAAADCRDWFDPLTIAQRTISFYSRLVAGGASGETY